MKFHKTVLRAANALFNTILILLLLVTGTYSGYALWDDNRIYASAGDVQADMIRIKPEIIVTEEEKEPGADFSALLEVNPDVCGWIAMDNTEIDYPILQGTSNHVYINTDIYGNFSLAGSIFLDSRNNRDFSNVYSLLYGHHMADHKMFGDLDLYKDPDFFQENCYGLLILPEGTYKLETFSCLLVGASEDNIFEPNRWKDNNIQRFLKWVREKSMYINEDVLSELETTKETFRILALSTCSYEFTDARTIVLTVLRPYVSAE